MDPSAFTYDVASYLRPNAFTGSANDIFLGWARTPNGQVEFRDRENVKNLTAIDEDVVRLYARWGNGTFTVMFNTNGGIGNVPASETVNAGSAITLPGSAGLSKDGRTFGGWNSRADGTGSNFNPFALFTPSDNVTLYAKWIITFTVIFDANAGDGTVPAPQTVNAGSDITIPGAGDLSKNGFTFGGWNTRSDGTGNNFSAGAEFTPTGNITLYARWNHIGAGNTFTVTFNVNGGTGAAPAPQTVATGSYITLPSGAEISKGGHTFGGWNTRADGTGAGLDAGSTYTPTGNVILYARWTAIFTVTFSLNGGSGAVPAPRTINEGDEITLPGGAGISRGGGYVFGGWNTRADGTGVTLSANAVFSPTGSVRLYVNWVDINRPALGETIAEQLAWLQTNALSGGFYIVDIIGDEDIAPHTLSFASRNNVTITMRGVDVPRNIGLTANGALFTVASGVTLELGENVTLNGRIGNTNALVRINSGGTLVMNTGARITSNMNGATVVANMGGGVHIASGTFIMNGGEISDNTTLGANNGGGVHMAGGTFTMRGGEISDNTAQAGGGVWLQGARSTQGFWNEIVYSAVTFTMSGGIIANNIASTTGGGVNIAANGTFNMNGGTISGNTASMIGGGVHVDARTRFATFFMRSGVISGNHAAGTNGGGGIAMNGINVSQQAIFHMSGGVIYGIIAAQELRNTGTNAVLWRGGGGTATLAQRGIFSGTTFTSLGNLYTTNETIRVVNGVLQP